MAGPIRQYPYDPQDGALSVGSWGPEDRTTGDLEALKKSPVAKAFLHVVLDHSFGPLAPDEIRMWTQRLEELPANQSIALTRVLLGCAAGGARHGLRLSRSADQFGGAETESPPSSALVAIAQGCLVCGHEFAELASVLRGRPTEDPLIAPALLELTLQPDPAKWPGILKAWMHRLTNEDPQQLTRWLPKMLTNVNLEVSLAVRAAISSVIRGEAGFFGRFQAFRGALDPAKVEHSILPLISGLRRTVAGMDQNADRLAASALVEACATWPFYEDDEDFSRRYWTLVVASLSDSDFVVRANAMACLRVFLDFDDTPPNIVQRWAMSEALESGILSFIRMMVMAPEQLRQGIENAANSTPIRPLFDINEVALAARRSFVADACRLLEACANTNPNAVRRALAVLAPMIPLARPETRAIVPMFAANLVILSMGLDGVEDVSPEVLGELIQAIARAYWEHVPTEETVREVTDAQLLSSLSTVLGHLSSPELVKSQTNGILFDASQRTINARLDPGGGDIRCRTIRLLWMLRDCLLTPELRRPVSQMLDTEAGEGFRADDSETALVSAESYLWRHNDLGCSAAGSGEGWDSLRRASVYGRFLQTLAQPIRLERFGSLLESIAGQPSGSSPNLDWNVLAVLAVSALSNGFGKGLAPSEDIGSKLSLLGGRRFAWPVFQVPGSYRASEWAFSGEAVGFPEAHEFLAAFDQTLSRNFLPQDGGVFTQAGVLSGTLTLLSYVRLDKLTQTNAALNAIVDLARVRHPELVACALFAFGESLIPTSPIVHKLRTALQMIRNLSDTAQQDLLEPVWAWGTESGHRQVKAIAAQTLERIEHGPDRVL
jgi:hypothetical protein